MIDLLFSWGGAGLVLLLVGGLCIAHGLPVLSERHDPYETKPPAWSNFPLFVAGLLIALTGLFLGFKALGEAQSYPY